ncbi:MAG: 4Fe-4S dicluster domain-containing protein [Clostridiales bacterium]|nr:4Fe-4S dicluster domain-containing protein [Clostridiales bacterium]MCF8021381.1 4Fe-4S dicluster domain-containing protein [Clostridiales bacterium]
MATRLDPNLKNELEEFGVKDLEKCYQCGLCTGVCPLSSNDDPFPRKMVRYAQMGLKDKLIASPEPWLCYYCGECSDFCPREANPGETMMALRRYLTAQYDWTGISKRFYTSHVFEIFSVIGFALLIGLGFLLFAGSNPDMQQARLSTFVETHVIEYLDILMAVVLSAFLLSNVYRMIKFQMGDLLQKVPLSMYMSEVKELILHFLTQKRFSECSDKRMWYIHLLIMTSYTLVFLLVVGLLSGIGGRLPAFQTDEVRSFFHIYNLIGYYATFGLLFGTSYAMIGRIRKNRAIYQFSHATDWMFLILLWLTALTGILIHIFRVIGGDGMPAATYIVYTLHLMVAVPMLVLEVPFAKWSHLAYRPVTIVVTNVKKKYENSIKFSTPAASDESQSA